MSDVLKAVKELKDTLDGQLKKVTEEQEKLAESVKSLGGDKLEKGVCLADEVKAQREKLANMEKTIKEKMDAIEQYTKQLPNLNDTRYAQRDPEYKGLFPNAGRAKQFGLYVMAGTHPDGGKRRAAAERLLESGMLIRDLAGQTVKGEDYAKAMGESADSAGGYLVPEEFVPALIRNVDKYGVFRANCRKVPMSSDRQAWPKRTGGLTVYYPDEGVAVTASDMTFGLVTLTAKKWAVATYYSRELAEDAAIGLGEILAFEFGLAMALAEDTNGFMGDGTSAYAGVIGVFSSANVAVVTMPSGSDAFTDLAYTDLIDLKYGTPDWVRKMPDCAYYMHPEFAGVCEKMVDATSGQPLFQRPTEGFPLRIGGYPVKESNVLPGLAATAASTKMLAFGSLMAWGMMGQRRGFSLESDRSIKFMEGQIAVKAVARQDIQEADGNAMAVLRTAAS